MHGTLWKAVTLRLHHALLPMEAWERQLNPALKNLRSLVCRRIGQTTTHLPLTFFFCLYSGDSSDSVSIGSPAPLQYEPSPPVVCGDGGSLLSL